MVDRLKILAKIDDIENKHCSICTIDVGNTNKYCHTKCDIGKELKSYGDQLLGNRQSKLEKILAKRKNMTTNEVKYLLEQGVTRSKLAKVIGIKDQTKVKPYFDELEGSIEMTTKMERAREIMQKDKDIKAKDLAEKIDVSVNNAYVYMSKIRNESTKPMKKLKPKEVSPNRFERENKTLKAELKAVEKEVEKLEKINNDHLEMIKQRDEKSAELKQKLSDYKRGEIAIANGKTLELENFIERLKEKLYKKEQRINELIDESKQEINKLQKELDQERASHENLSKYAVILMQKESAGA